MAKKETNVIEGKLVQTGLTAEDRAMIEAPGPTSLLPATITSEEQYKDLGQQRIDVNDQLKKIKQLGLKVRQRMDAAKDEVMELLFNKPIAARQDFISRLDPLLLGYQREVQAERQRINDEINEAAAAAQRKIEEEAEARARKLEKKGHVDAAAAVRNAIPIAAPTMSAPVKGPTIDGMSTQKRWKAKITDPKALLAARPDLFLENMKVLEIVERSLDKKATESKGTAIIPGVEFYPEEGLRS